MTHILQFFRSNYDIIFYFVLAVTMT